MPETTKQNLNARSNQVNSQSTRHSSTRSKGKSKYSQKSRSKPKGPVAVKRGPSNTYTSVCCGAPSKKPACVRVDKKKAAEQGLGSWRCFTCGKSCRVVVSKYKAPEALLVEVTNV